MIGYVLLGLGVLVLIAGGFYQANTKTPRKIVKEKDGITIERSANTDKTPPAGFSAHYQLIIDTAPTATASIRETYALSDMSEADILVAERQRLEKLVAESKKVKAPTTTNTNTPTSNKAKEVE